MIASAPKVTIGLAVYNGANYLAEAIESVLAQTFENIELVISDNASTDATEEICRSFVGGTAEFATSVTPSTVVPPGTSTIRWTTRAVNTSNGTHTTM